MHSDLISKIIRARLSGRDKRRLFRNIKKYFDCYTKRLASNPLSRDERRLDTLIWWDQAAEFGIRTYGYWRATNDIVR